MLVTIGAPYSIKVFGQIASKPMLNVFWYKPTSEDVPPLNEGHIPVLAETFTDTVVEGWKECVSSKAVIQRGVVENYVNELGIYEFNIGVSGVRSDQYINSFSVYAFSFGRTKKVTRKGQKRLSGVVEEDIADAVANSTQRGKLNALAALFASSLTTVVGDQTIIWKPIIVHRIKFTNTETGKTYYVPDPSTFQDVSSVTYEKLSSQVSRKE